MEEMKKPFLYYPFISQNGLENLKTYAYHGQDNSICGRVFLNNFWEWCLKLMPTWVAPNLTTLSGGIFCAIATALAMHYSPTYTEIFPRWVCFAFVICLFLYQTMDNIDGKQARRTGAGSPLGELFDHGVDALVMGMFPGFMSMIAIYFILKSVGIEKTLLALILVYSGASSWIPGCQGLL